MYDRFQSEFAERQRELEEDMYFETFVRGSRGDDIAITWFYENRPVAPIDPEDIKFIRIKDSGNPNLIRSASYRAVDDTIYDDNPFYRKINTAVTEVIYKVQRIISWANNVQKMSLPQMQERFDRVLHHIEEEYDTLLRITKRCVGQSYYHTSARIWGIVERAKEHKTELQGIIDKDKAICELRDSITQDDVRDFLQNYTSISEKNLPLLNCVDIKHWNGMSNQVITIVGSKYDTCNTLSRYINIQSLNLLDGVTSMKLYDKTYTSHNVWELVREIMVICHSKKGPVEITVTYDIDRMHLFYLMSFCRNNIPIHFTKTSHTARALDRLLTQTRGMDPEITEDTICAAVVRYTKGFDQILVHEGMPNCDYISRALAEEWVRDRESKIEKERRNHDGVKLSLLHDNIVSPSKGKYINRRACMEVFTDWIMEQNITMIRFGGVRIQNHSNLWRKEIIFAMLYFHRSVDLMYIAHDC